MSNYDIKVKKLHAISNCGLLQWKAPYSNPEFVRRLARQCVDMHIKFDAQGKSIVDRIRAAEKQDDTITELRRDNQSLAENNDCGNPYLAVEVNRLEQERDALAQSVEDQTAIITTLKQQRNNAIHANENCKTVIARLRSEEQVNYATMSELRDSHDELMVKNTALKVRVADQKSTFETDFDAQTDEIQNLTNKVADLHSTLNDQSSTIRNGGNENTRLNKEIIDLKNVITGRDNDLRTLLKKREDEDEIIDLKSILSALRARVRDSNVIIDQLKAELNASKNTTTALSELIAERKKINDRLIKVAEDQSALLRQQNDELSTQNDALADYDDVVETLEEVRDTADYLLSDIARKAEKEVDEANGVKTVRNVTFDIETRATPTIPNIPNLVQTALDQAPVSVKLNGNEFAPALDRAKAPSIPLKQSAIIDADYSKIENRAMGWLVVNKGSKLKALSEQFPNGDAFDPTAKSVHVSSPITGENAVFDELFDLEKGVEEGATCNRIDGQDEVCKGTMQWQEVENCSCHLGHPPCSSCTSVELECTECLYVTGDNSLDSLVK